MTNFLNEFNQKVHDFEHDILKSKMPSGEPVFSKFNVVNPKNARSLVVYGDNVSGKSLIGKLAEVLFRKNDFACRNACVRNRVTSGFQRMAVYGDETEASTGATSFSTIEKAFKSAKKDEKESIVILDEADLGLSPKFSRTLGKYVADFINENNHIFILLISHNHVFLDAYQRHLNQATSSIGINTEHSFFDWINSDEFAGLDELRNLKTLNDDKWQAIENTIKEIREKKNIK